MFNKTLAPGAVIADMHGHSVYTHPDLTEDFEVRNVVMFHAEHFGAFLSTIRAGYVNKHLMVIAEPWGFLDDDAEWWPCAYSYDAQYACVCEVRKRNWKPL